jgi:hypothetical protein
MISMVFGLRTLLPPFGGIKRRRVGSRDVQSAQASECSATCGGYLGPKKAGDSGGRC